MTFEKLCDGIETKLHTHHRNGLGNILHDLITLGSQLRTIASSLKDDEKLIMLSKWEKIVSQYLMDHGAYVDTFRSSFSFEDTVVALGGTVTEHSIADTFEGIGFPYANLPHQFYEGA